MKLFYAPGACSLVVRIILNELGIKFDDEAVDLRVKKTAGGENYLEINPKGAVPAMLLNNEMVLTENQVILQYLADNNSGGEKLLAPIPKMERYKTLEWLNYISTELHKTLGSFFNPNMPDEVKSQVLTPMVMAKFKFINEHLAKNTYLMGNEFTLPDAYLFVMVRWTHYFKMDLSAFSNLQRLMNQLETRPSVMKAMQQEQLA